MVSHNTRRSTPTVVSKDIQDVKKSLLIFAWWTLIFLNYFWIINENGGRLMASIFDRRSD